jgi:hypothetical protein
MFFDGRLRVKEAGFGGMSNVVTNPDPYWGETHDDDWRSGRRRKSQKHLHEMSSEDEHSRTLGGRLAALTKFLDESWGID